MGSTGLGSTAATHAEREGERERGHASVETGGILYTTTYNNDQDIALKIIAKKHQEFCQTLSKSLKNGNSPCFLR